MTRAELIEKLAQSNTMLTLADVDAGARLILDEMHSTLARGDRIELRGFGTFSIAQREGRKARNPKTGEPVQVPPKRAIHFKTGKELRLSVAQTAVV